MSHDAYCLYLCRRALARPLHEVGPRSRPHYERRVQQLAQRLIGAGL